MKSISKVSLAVVLGAALTSAALAQQNHNQPRNAPAPAPRVQNVAPQRASQPQPRFQQPAPQRTFQQQQAQPRVQTPAPQQRVYEPVRFGQQPVAQPRGQQTPVRSDPWGHNAPVNQTVRQSLPTETQLRGHQGIGVGSHNTRNENSGGGWGTAKIHGYVGSDNG